MLKNVWPDGVSFVMIEVALLKEFANVERVEWS